MPTYAGSASHIIDTKMNTEVPSKKGLKLGDTLGVVLYAYKQAKN
jgi:hypothetical protein